MPNFTKISDLKVGDKYRHVYDSKETIRTLEKETTNTLIVIKIIE